MIRLHKDAPWNQVKIGDITITKTKWIEENFDYRPVQKYIIFKKEEPEIVTGTIVEEKSIVDSIDYSKLTKQELIKLCGEKGLETKGKSKSALIDILTL